MDGFGAGDAPLQWLGLTWNAAYNSFPSGHSADIATSAFCLCLLLARPFPLRVGDVRKLRGR